MTTCKEKIVKEGEERTSEDRASENHGENLRIMKLIHQEARASGSSELLVTGRIQAKAV